MINIRSNEFDLAQRCFILRLDDFGLDFASYVFKIVDNRGGHDYFVGNSAKMSQVPHIFVLFIVETRKVSKYVRERVGQYACRKVRPREKLAR